MSPLFLIERRIEIDAGHRATYHNAKCSNLHGHRYTVIVSCVGPLIETGPQKGMVLDFGQLKTILKEEVDEPCDHTTILWVEDPLVQALIPDHEAFKAIIRPCVAEQGYCRVEDSLSGVLYLLNGMPTAENLAAHWYNRIKPRIAALEGGRVLLQQIKVYESPQCMAAYPALCGGHST